MLTLLQSGDFVAGDDRCEKETEPCIEIFSSCVHYHSDRLSLTMSFSSGIPPCSRHWHLMGSPMYLLSYNTHVA